MATVAPPADQAAELLQKLSLDSQAKTLEIPEPAKKTAVYQYGAVDSNVQVPPFERSLTPLLPSDALDPSICFVPNGYQPFYFGGYGSGHDWNEYAGYTNPDGVDLTSGIYGENGSLVYPQGYGYAAYPYSPATSPAPPVGNDGQLYGAQQYQYPSYFPLTTSSGPFSSIPAASSQGDLSTNKAADQKQFPVEGANATSATSKSGIGNANSGSASVKPFNQSTLNASSNSYGNGALGLGAFPATYQDPRFSYDAFYPPMTWHDGPKFSDVQRPLSGAGVTSSFSKANGVAPSRHQNYRSNSHFTGLHQPASMTGFGTPQGYYNRMYPNKLYGHYASTIRSGMGYGSAGYDSRTNGRGWLGADNKYRSRGRGNNYYYGNDYVDGLNELNRGPRAKGTKTQKATSETSLDVKGQSGTSNAADVGETDKTCVVPDREQYNREDFSEDYADAKFFVIKSYSEDDVHKSIKYNVWASTPNGNKKLDAAYQEAQQKSGSCPVFLFFSVNASGQFVGLAEMIGPVDFNKNVEYWQQDKWTGSFPLKWHVVKDVPNGLLKHITLENNENKPVTNSRDTQEVKLEQGLKMIKIFREHSSKTCILDDFAFYEVRQKTIQEKKAKQQQQSSQKQVWEGKTTDDKKESTNGPATADLAKDSASAVEPNGDLKVAENGSVAKTGDPANNVKQVSSLANGVANGC